MIFLGSFGFRYLELALLAALVVMVALLFVRRKSPGLVWVSAAVMALLAVHLFLEDGRWQMLPVYLLLTGFSFWLALPGDNRLRWWRLVVRIAIIVFLVIPALLLPFATPLFRVAEPSGEFPVGTATLHVEMAPPSAERTATPDETDGGEAGRVSLRVWYPAAEATELLGPFWTPADTRQHRLPGYPRLFATHLALVPTPAYLRAPVAEGALPILMILPGTNGLPGDFIHLALDAASSGWFVVRLPRDAAPEAVVAGLEGLVAAEADQAVQGKLNANRVVLLIGPDADVPDLGFASIVIGDGAAATALGPAGGLQLALPDASVPEGALTYRHHITTPSMLLIGSSDVSPAAIEGVMRRFFSLILADGSLSAPIFSGAYPTAEEILQSASFGATGYATDERAQ